ncbi:MAG: hydrogenase nickel incorporation protein HypB [Solobacterium sp.]|nr:hydrogenase nickel incorporation protein HypB [Solobacterium sp.]
MNDEYRIIETKERITADNEKAAEQVREKMRKNGAVFINLMASPGAGKTSTLVRTIEALRDEFRIGVMEADVDSDVDARTMHDLGVRVIQLHTGGSCHMDADMTLRGIEELGMEDLDVIILENVGNLVCPAEFDTGADVNVMILSVPEGDDKPLKYPLMFSVSEVMLVNKTDVLPVFDFDLKKAEERAKQLNPDITVFPVSAKTGEGYGAWISWLRNRIGEFRR